MKLCPIHLITTREKHSMTSTLFDVDNKLILYLRVGPRIDPITFDQNENVLLPSFHRYGQVTEFCSVKQKLKGLGCRSGTCRRP